MKNLKSFVRVLVLAGLFISSMALLIAEESACSGSGILLLFVVDKVVAVMAFLCVSALYKRWRKKDRWINTYDKICNGVTGTSDQV